MLGATAFIACNLKVLMACDIDQKQGINLQLVMVHRLAYGISSAVILLTAVQVPQCSHLRADSETAMSIRCLITITSVQPMICLLLPSMLVTLMSRAFADSNHL